MLIQEDYFKNIFNTVHEGIIILDSDLRVLSANRSFYDSFKVTPEETIGNLIYDLGNKQWDIPKLWELLETILSQQTTFNNYEVEHNFTAIGRRIMLLNARQIERGSDKERIILLAIEDITERKEIENSLKKAHEELMELAAELERSTQVKSEFLANMSHELRTPLNSIIGFSEVLEDSLYGKLNEKQHEYVNNIYLSGKHLLSLINDILDLSKVESGKMEFELCKVSIKEILNATLMMVKEKAMTHSISLTLDVQPDADISIEADDRKLKQIMYNLLSNAVKFTQDGGSVSVNARHVGADLRVCPKEGEHTGSSLQDRDFIEISVADTGIGIKPEDIPKLFNKFTQFESAYTKNYEGTGLGLALTKMLVELHGGKIWVESESGKGSSFTFVIPVRQPKA